MAATRSRPTARRIFDSRSEEQTRRLGEACGRLVDSPMVIALIGDLGSGKTMFVQGLARGLDVPEGYCVTSPSFTLINEYPGRRTLAHIDLYRLEAGFDLDDLGLVDVLKSDGVAAVEWADKLPPAALPEKLEVRFEIGAGDGRRLHFAAYGQDASGLLRSISLSDAGRGSPAPEEGNGSNGGVEWD